MNFLVTRQTVRARIAAMTFACLMLPAALISYSSIAQAETWPARPVKIIVPYAPGGTADILGRIAAEQLSKAFNQQFIVENRGGAGGLVGSAVVATADPDGYTLLVSGIPTLVVAPATSANPPFDPIRDFSHIAYLGGVPLVVIANPALGVDTYKGLVALAKRTEQGISYVSPGAGTHAHLFGEYLARKDGIKLNHIPYKGASPAMMDLMAGHVPLGVMSWSASLEQMRAGKVKALAVSSVDRLPEYPSVMTFKELGYDDLTAATWFSLSGPAKLPRDIVERLNRAVVSGLQTPEARTRLAQEVIETRPLTPDEFTSFVQSEITRWLPIIKAVATSGN